MSRVQIGRTVRRLRTERNLSQQALANRLGISASYLNLIEHDQRAVSGTLLIKLAETFHLDLATLSGSQRRHARYPAARACSTVGKNVTFFRSGRRLAQLGLQKTFVVFTA